MAGGEWLTFVLGGIFALCLYQSIVDLFKIYKMLRCASCREAKLVKTMGDMKSGKDSKSVEERSGAKGILETAG